MVEPLPDSSPLWDLPNVLISPHSASTAPSENGKIVEAWSESDVLGMLQQVGAIPSPGGS
jgi:phosphoglycerate dehydrogenase-like enzyme